MGQYLFGGYGWVFQLLILVLLLAVFWWMLQGQRSIKSETPLDIAKRRYAAGDITKKEYEQLKKDLMP